MAGMPVYLDALGQQPTLNIYTQLSLAFDAPPASDNEHGCYDSALTILTAGLGRLASALPWTAGKVIEENSEKHVSGVFKIVEWASMPPLSVRDLRGNASVPTMESLKRANFPMSMLDESIFASYPTLPGGIAGEGPDPTAVFGVRGCFIDGGLVLTFVGHHQAMDFVGLVQIMRLLDKACRGEPFSAIDHSASIMDRRSVVPLLDAKYKPGPEVERQTCKPVTETAEPLAPSSSPSAASWVYFAFSPATLAVLKDMAMETATHAYVSTDDALTAFIWQSVARARLRRIDSNVEVTLGRAVDGRRYLGLPQEYPGMLNSMVYLTHPIGKLVDTSLGEIATQLRQAVDPSTSNLGYAIRALATMYDRAPDRALISASATINPSSDLMISSWGIPDCHTMDFGLGLNAPVTVRRPRFTPVEGLGYLLPKHPETGVTVAICLSNADLTVLRTDQRFLLFAMHIG